MNSFPESELPSHGAATGEAVMNQARHAAGGAACGDLRSLRIEGQVNAGGLSGSFDQHVDVERRRSVRTFVLGPAGYTSGFDGVGSWRRGPNGDLTVQDTEAGLRSALTQAWLDARAWCSPTHDATQVDSLGIRLADGREHDVVSVLPVGGNPAQLWFDRATHLLALAVQQDMLGRELVTRFDDYRAVDGVQLPFRMRTGSGDVRFDRVVTADRIFLNEPIAEADFKAPSGGVGQVEFVAGDESATIGVAVIQNTIVVPVSIDGHSLSFVLDSGGTTLLTAATAARLGLRSEGQFEASGMSGNTVSVGFVRARQLIIGSAVVLSDQLLHVLPMPGASDVLGAPVDGILGAEVFRRLVLRIDYELEAITLLRQPAKPEPDWGERLPLTFLAHIPCVDGVLDGQAKKFLLDTGNSGAVLLHARPDAAPRDGASAATTIGWGVGGAIAGRLARGRCLKLGGVEIEAPALRMLEDDNRSMLGSGVAGNVGGAVLSRFLVTFDYAASAVWLAPNTRLGAPFHVDRSGVRIHANNDGFEVVAVMAGSPADNAGLRVGDVLVTVDGVPARAIALHAQRRAWQETPVGTRVAVRVNRSGTLFDAEVVLRNLIPGD